MPNGGISPTHPTEHPTTVISRDGVSLPSAYRDANVDYGNVFENDGLRTFVHAFNRSHSVTQTLVIETTAVVDGESPPYVSYEIGTRESLLIGPFPALQYNRTSAPYLDQVKMWGDEYLQMEVFRV